MARGAACRHPTEMDEIVFVLDAGDGHVIQSAPIGARSFGTVIAANAGDGAR